MPDKYDLLIPFLDDDPAFAYGCQFGMDVVVPVLAKQDVIENYFCLALEEQIRVACHRLGYAIKEYRIHDEDLAWISMEREER